MISNVLGTVGLAILAVSIGFQFGLWWGTGFAGFALTWAAVVVEVNAQRQASK